MYKDTFVCPRMGEIVTFLSHHLQKRTSRSIHGLYLSSSISTNPTHSTKCIHKPYSLPSCVLHFLPPPLQQLSCAFPPPFSSPPSTSCSINLTLLTSPTVPAIPPLWPPQNQQAVQDPQPWPQTQPLQKLSVLLTAGGLVWMRFRCRGRRGG